MSKAVVGVFPGQGSQSVGMGKELYQNFTEAKRTFEEASDVLKIDMAQLCFDDPEQKLNLTEFTQPALLTVSIAAFRVLQSNTGLALSSAAGHSLGEYSALVAGEILSFGDALSAVHFRGQAMQRAVPVGVGAMLAYIGTQGQKVSEICENETRTSDVVEVANYNSPGQMVLSGHATAVKRVGEIITKEKLGRGILLSVSAPFHSSLMAPAAEEMSRFLENVKFQKGTTEILANVDAKIYAKGTYEKTLLIRQICGSVLWTQTLQSLNQKYENPLWVEVGSGAVLQGLLKKTLDSVQSFGTGSLEAIEKLQGILK